MIVDPQIIHTFDTDNIRCITRLFVDIKIPLQGTKRGWILKRNAEEKFPVVNCPRNWVII